MVEVPAPGGDWTWAGAASLWGGLAEVAEWPRAGAVADLPTREVPEPTEGQPPDEVQRRLWRATWLPEHDLADARARAEGAGRVLVAPHLDVAVLAWLGALAPALRARLREG